MKQKKITANKLSGTVAPWNKAGQKFYERLGAEENKDWLNYEWKL